MSQVAVHHPSSYAYSGQVGLPATITGGSSATFSWKNLEPNTAFTVIWGDASGNGSFTSDATGAGSAAHTYANGTYTQIVQQTSTSQPEAKRTFTVPYAGGGGFAPRLAQESVGSGEGAAPMVQKLNGEGDYEEYDPGAYTVAEVLSEVQGGQDDEFIRDVLAAEMAGKNRSSLVTQLQEMLPFDPSDFTVADVEAYAEANPDQIEDIIAAERAGKNRVTLINHLNSLR